MLRDYQQQASDAAYTYFTVFSNEKQLTNVLFQ